MKTIYLESKDQRWVMDKFNKIKPDAWKAYIKTDYETLGDIYVIECYVAEGVNNGNI